MVREIGFNGLVAAVFTPFDENNEVNYGEIPKYAEYLNNLNVKAVLVNGTVGEGASLTSEERKKVLQKWVDVCKTTEQKVFAQIGGMCLNLVKEAAEQAESLNVSAILCLPDLFYKPTTIEDLIYYLKEVSESAPNTPLLYYHQPRVTGVNLDMKKFLEIGFDQLPTLAGIKYTHPILVDELRCLSVHPERFTIFHGYDQILSASFMMGVKGAMTTSMNFAPALVQNIQENIQQGRNSAEAVMIERRMMTLTGTLLNITSWTAGYKAVTSMISGLNLGKTRPPVKPINDEQLSKIRAELQVKGWLR